MTQQILECNDLTKNEEKINSSSVLKPIFSANTNVELEEDDCKNQESKNVDNCQNFQRDSQKIHSNGDYHENIDISSNEINVKDNRNIQSDKYKDNTIDKKNIDSLDHPNQNMNTSIENGSNLSINNQYDKNRLFPTTIIDYKNSCTLIISDFLKNLMENKCVKSIVFRYPRFAIKSYGKEKRYLCPPPHICIFGSSWKNYVSKLLSNNIDLNEKSFQNEFMAKSNDANHYNNGFAFNQPSINLQDQNMHDFDKSRRISNFNPNEQYIMNQKINNNANNSHNFHGPNISNYYQCPQKGPLPDIYANDYPNTTLNSHNFSSEESFTNNSNIIMNRNTNKNQSIMDFSQNYNRFNDSPITKIYSRISLPGVILPDDGHIELDETNNGYATRIYIPENKDLNQSIILNSTNSFTFLVSLFINKSEICSFSSSQIKLKSKAMSYTKQAINNCSEDMCLSSGSVISLYSRLHAHKSNTRFLSTYESRFIVHPLYWDSYIIYKVSEDSEEAEFDVIKGLIHYGDYVKILSIKHDISLPTMRIQPTNTSNKADSKPVQYLSRISLQMRYNKDLYLCISNQKSISPEKAMIKHQKDSSYHVKEEAIWTLTKISTNFYSFIEIFDSPMPISPFPVIENIIFQGSSKNYYLKFIGYNLSQSYTVWLGDKCCSTYFQSSENLLAIFPNINSLTQYLVTQHLMKIPVFLVRQDLVVFPCQFSLELRFNSFHSRPEDFTFVAKYESLDPNFENPDIKSLNLIH